MTLKAFVAPDVGNGLRVAGAANGVYTLAGCLRDGAEKATAIASELGFNAGRSTVAGD